MQKPQALLIHSLGASVGAIQKLLEDRGFQVQLTRGWEEWDRIETALPLERLQFLFADISLCEGRKWEEFLQNY